MGGERGQANRAGWRGERLQDPPSFPHEVVKSGLAPFLSRLWGRDLDGNPWTAAER